MTVKRTCPPCDSLCNQGRNCPANNSDQVDHWIAQLSTKNDAFVIGHYRVWRVESDPEKVGIANLRSGEAGVFNMSGLELVVSKYFNDNF